MAATEDISDRLARLTTQEKSTQLQMGWTLSKPRTGATRFPQKVRDYLITRFDLGEATGNKADPNQVSLDMRAAKGQNLRRDIQEAIDVAHLIIYDVYNLCELRTENMLKNFKVIMLKKLCDHFDIQFKSRD